MAGDASFILTMAAGSLARCQALAEEIEADFAIDPVALAINETDEARGLWEVVAYFPTEAAAAAARDRLGAAAAAVAPLAERDWVRQSLAGLPPVAAGRFFLHGAHDRARRRPGGIALEIDAGTAFGTGHHGTTEGCLLVLDRLVKRRKFRNVLDLGCGTGVLAIAAARLLNGKVLASDIDREAVAVTRRNAAINGVGPFVAALHAAGLKDPRIAAAAPFDLVFANILARPLVNLASGLSQVLAPGGALVLSGLTLDQSRWLLATYRNRGLVPTALIRRGNWATLVFTRPTKKRPQRVGRGRSGAGATGPGREDA